jgi:hypothetical protein
LAWTDDVAAGKELNASLANHLQPADDQSVQDQQAEQISGTQLLKDRRNVALAAQRDDLAYEMSSRELVLSSLEARAEIGVGVEDAHQLGERHGQVVPVLFRASNTQLVSADGTGGVCASIDRRALQG